MSRYVDLDESSYKFFKFNLAAKGLKTCFATETDTPRAGPSKTGTQ